MSTHKARCVVCHADCFCCNDTHALGCGNGGCESTEPEIAFCSLACAEELQRRLVERIAIYHAIVAGEL